jgi:hypothetical protein
MIAASTATIETKLRQSTSAKCNNEAAQLHAKSNRMTTFETIDSTIDLISQRNQQKQLKNIKNTTQQQQMNVKQSTCATQTTFIKKKNITTIFTSLLLLMMMLSH